jgi:hypothetical protein
MLALQGRYDEALVRLRAARVQNPTDPLVPMAIGKTLAARKAAGQ